MSKPNTIPGEDDWGTDYDPDRSWAKKTYFLKSREEMLPRFMEFPTSAAEDLHAMPEVPFQYYVFCFESVLCSGQYSSLAAQFDTAAEAASSFLTLLQLELELCPKKIVPLMDDLLPIADFIAANQAKFEPDRSEDDSFLKRLDKIKLAYKDRILGWY